MLENMPSNPMPTSSQLNPIISDLKAIDTLRQISSVLSWDQETMMPANAIDSRSNQLAAIAGLIHDAWNSPSLADAMSTIIDLSTGQATAELSLDEAAFMRELYATWRQQTQLSKPLVEALSKATSTAQHAWQVARNQNDYSIFSPHLSTIVSLTKEKISELGFDDHPYDPLINEFEPGMTVKKLDDLFNPLKIATIDFLSCHQPTKYRSIQGPFESNAQIQYSKELMAAMGYNTDSGRLDLSTHPFTIDIHPSDVRITTRVNPNCLFESVSSTIHEIGHGLYEQGLDPAWAFTPYGAARSMGIHESQSRLWEIFIGQSMAFWDGQLPRIHTLFPTTKTNNALDFFHAASHIRPHWCRVESDVVTYNLHIMIRYECEKALFTDDLDVKDLPAFWNQKMADYLRLDISNDAQGCLQDVHWSAGLFGYFPSYTLGTLIAAELYHVLETTIGNLDDVIRSGDFSPITLWLNQHIHFHGSKKTTDELLSDLNIKITPSKFIELYAA